MPRRQCDECKAHMGAYEPRTRVGDQMLCDACVRSPRGGLVSATASADHDVLYHLTDKHRFALDPDYAPEDNALAINSRAGNKGLYAAGDSYGVNSWRHGHGYQRPYVAEVHVPKGLVQDGRWNGEKFLPAEHFDQAKVHRVIPVDQHENETYYPGQDRLGTIEEYHGSRSPGAGKDVRDFTPEEHTEHLKRLRDYVHDVHGWGWNEFNDKHEHVGTDEFDDDGMEIRRGRDGSVMTRGRYAKKKGLPKTQKCEYCDSRATKRLLWAEGMAYIPTCDAHEPDGRHRIEVTNKDEVVSVKPIKSSAVRKIAHDSGDGMTIYHCPFCGSGQVIARSDRTIECQYCHIAFTVQVQPQFANFPQTVNGMPMQVPGMPGQVGDPAAGGMPPGSDPNAPMDPDALDADGAPAPGEAMDGSGDPAEAEDPEQPDDPADGESDEGNPFAKKSLLTASGVALPADEYVNHVAIAYAADKSRTAALVRARRG